MADLKPIETRYRGNRFRSRLEARWAVFFDHLGVEWEYEKEGYDLGVYGWYLPDFWLPGLKSWLEVKPDRVELGDAFSKARALSFASDFTSVLVAHGGAGDNLMAAYLQESTNSGGGFAEHTMSRFCLCQACGVWVDYWNGQPRSHVAVDAEWNPLPECTCQQMVRDADGYPVDSKAFEDWCWSSWLRTYPSVLAARSARFEHGESG